MAGWGSFLGKIADYVPGRKERYRKKIDQIKGEMDELIKKKMSSRDIGRYQHLADLLRKYEKSIKDIS